MHHNSFAATRLRKLVEDDLNNPNVWVLFQKFAFEMIRRGFEHYSGRAVVDRLRWETDQPIHDGDAFKINNYWSVYYGRKFRDFYPLHADFFRLRESMLDDVWVTLKPPKGKP
jgi:hypothetical protein